MGEHAALLQRYMEVLALGGELLDILDHPLTGNDAPQRVKALLSRRRVLLEQCAGLVGTAGPGDEAILSMVQSLVQQQQELEKAWAVSLSRMGQSSAQSRQARQSLHEVRRLLDTGPRSHFVDQRR